MKTKMDGLVRFRSNPFAWFNLCFVVLLALLAIFDMGLFTFFGFIILGPMQFMSASVGAVLGDRRKLIYVVASTLFLVLYFGMINGYFSFLRTPLLAIFSEDFLLMGTPLSMALVYCFLLFYEPVHSTEASLLDDILDH